MRGCRATLFALVLAPSLAWAQTPPESVTVTGTKSREVLQGFVHSFAAPARLTGKMARWGEGICPVAVGVRPEFVKFINRRLKEVAARVGAPVSERASCRTNIEIIFTTTPQALLDNVRRKQPVFLGYHNSSQAEKQATVTHVIQAWYLTATRDARGALQIDNPRPAGLINKMELPCPTCPLGKMEIYPPHVAAVTGSRLGDGLRSEFYNVIIVADPTRLLNHGMGELSDYIAMLALSQIGSQDACRQLPSIVNMLAEGCAQKTDTLTENDMAYLHGLYKAAPDQTLGTQQDQIAYQMEQELKGR
jgi:hypothetical protein